MLYISYRHTARNILHGQNVQKPIVASATNDMDVNVSVSLSSHFGFKAQLLFSYSYIMA